MLTPVPADWPIPPDLIEWCSRHRIMIGGFVDHAGVRALFAEIPVVCDPEPVHSHPQVSLELTLRGGYTGVVGSRRRDLSPGRVEVIPAGVGHTAVTRRAPARVFQLRCAEHAFASGVLAGYLDDEDSGPTALSEALFRIYRECLIGDESARLAVECGAAAVVLFDTWASSLTREDYRRYAAPWSRRILDELAGVAPRIVFGGAAAHLFEDMLGLDAEAVAIDHRMDIRRAFDLAEGRVALQGNLDPGALLSTPDEVRRRTRALLEAVDGRPGHVLNLGHGVFKTTDPDCVAAFVDTAREPRTTSAGKRAG